MAHKKLKLTGIPLVCLLLLCFSTSLFAGSRVDKQNLQDYRVTNLTVHDVENDDGSGLWLSWEPIPPEKAKIITYRVYRGVTPDSLFYIGEIPVNPMFGGVSGTMTFYDKDYNPFVDIASPRKLKKEKGQSADSPIYRAIPRNLEILGPMLNKFNLMAIIPKEEFYFKTTPVEKDGTVYAGMKTQQFPLYKKLIPGNEYYYTVIAVNQQRKFYPHADPVVGIPVDNPPEKPSHLYPVYLEDARALQFEWDMPLYKDDIRFFVLYAVADETAYNQWLENEEGNPPLTMISLITLPQPYTPPTFKRLEIRTTPNATYEGGQIVDDDGNEVYTFTKDIRDYKFALSYVDYSNQASYGDPEGVRVAQSSMIPAIPTVSIADRPNDKGDYMELRWGSPFARITSVTYLKADRSRLQLSYEVASNKDNKIKNIYFDIYDAKGEHIRRVNEFFVDNIIKVSIPAKFEPSKLTELTVKMTFNIKGKDYDESYYLTQNLHYDDQIMTLRPQKLYYGDFCVDDFNFQLLKRPKSTQLFRVSRKFPAFDRETVDLINYESSIFQGVDTYDLDRNMLLQDSNIDFIYDEETKGIIRTPIYASEALKVIENSEKMIAEYQSNLDNAETDAERAHWQMYVDYYTRQMDNQKIWLENNKQLKYINSYTNDKARMKALRTLREKDKREFTYQLLISDGKGLFNLVEVAPDPDGNPTFWIPESNLFKMEMIPALIASLVFGLLVQVMFRVARSGRDLYVRPIAGIEEIDNAIGRATEMGRPILYCTGLSGINDVATLAGLAILGNVAKKAAEYDTKILVPCYDNIVLPIASETVRAAHSEAGRPDSFDSNNIFFVASNQFAYVAGVNGVMIREKTATNFYMGMFFAESLIMTETGNTTGAIQIAGTDAITQIPFFITTCDYTLIGEELYAASAYMVRQPLQLGTLKACDYTKAIILFFMILGTLTSSLQLTQVIDLFPVK